MSDVQAAEGDVHESPGAGLRELTGFRRDLLVVISGYDPYCPPRGLTIKARIDEAYGADTGYGRFYPNLNHLVDEGLEEKGEIDGRSKWFRLTIRGRKMLEEHLD